MAVKRNGFDSDDHRGIRGIVGARVRMRGVVEVHAAEAEGLQKSFTTTVQVLSELSKTRL